MDDRKVQSSRAALKQLFDAHGRGVPLLPAGIRQWERHGLCLLTTSHVHMIIQMPGMDTDLGDQIGDLCEDWRLRDKPVLWRLYEGDDPEGILAEHLSKGGFRVAEEETLMGCRIADATAELPTGVEVIRVSSLDKLETAFDVMGTAFGMSPKPATPDRLESRVTQCFLASIDGRPAGVGLVDTLAEIPFCLLRAGGVKPEFRRRGIYTALVHERLRYAKRLGVTSAFSDARPSSRSRLEALGFDPVANGYVYELAPR